MKQKKSTTCQQNIITARKKADLSKLFGSLPRKMSGQAMKNMVRKGWD